MSMSKFVSHADYWKDRAERAEAKLAELDGQEPVVKYSGKRLTPEGTKEMWGYLLSEVEPRENQELYARPVPSEDSFVTVTTTEDGRCVMVSRQDEDLRILKVLWEAKDVPTEPVRLTEASREICYGKRAEALGTPEDQDRVVTEQDFAPPARLTNEEITSLLAASDNNSPRVPSFFIAEPHRFARTIETAVLRKNGLALED